MAQPRHMVQRQVMELHIDSSLNHKLVQDAIAKLQQEAIVPLLDEALTAQGGSATIYLPRLEIDLGKIAFSRLEKDFTGIFTLALQEALHRIQPLDPLALRQPTRSYIDQPQPGQPSHKPDPLQLPAPGALDLILHFLQTGLFPWWAQETTVPYVTQQLEELLAVQTDGPGRIFGLVAHSAAALLRLLNVFEDVMLMTLFERYTGESISPDFWQSLQTLPAFFAGKLPPQQIRQFRWRAFIESIVDAQTGRSGQPLMGEGLLLATTRHFVRQIAEIPGLLSWLQQEVLLTKALTKETVLLIQEGGSSLQGASQANATLQQAAKSATSLQGKVNDSLNQPADIEKVYIQNAGLVLLWPFLHRFFQQLQLADADGFTSVAAAERACLLLQYTATGLAEDMLEAQLPLNKLLCGVPLLQPLPTRWEIDPGEAEETGHFLQAIVEHGGDVWKNLSVKGLRQAYLNRQGILSSRDGSWLLQVERKPYDILMQRLPWNVSMVKLPWMERLIFVEW